MSAPSDYEQLILEMINRARLDPQAEAKRLGISLNKNLDPGEISGATKQPLAYNSTLNNAASDHSNWMLSNNVFSHTGAGGSDPGDRMATAGYNFTGSWTWGENIAWNGTTGSLNVLNAAIRAHDGLFNSAGHRLNILSANFKEIGLAGETGNYQGYKAFMLTEKFAKSGSGSFITGVAYTDADNDNFYSIGEGRGNVTVSFAKNGSNIGSKSTWNSGGYSQKTTSTGDIDVAFSGGGLPAHVAVTIDLASQNVKVDLIGTNHIETSASTTLGQNAVSLQLLGRNGLEATGNSLSNTITGNSAGNKLSGKAGNDTIRGAGGNDKLYGGANNDKLIGNGGNDSLYGQSGNDTLKGSAGRDILIGGGGNDRLIGGGYHDVLKGGNGRDFLSGGNGSDRLLGGKSKDVLKGGGGSDDLNGGTGNDRLTGQAGNDTFIFNNANWGKDTIRDFEDGLEKMDMRGSGVTAGDLKVASSNGNAVVTFGGDEKITLIGEAGNINAGDFIF